MTDYLIRGMTKDGFVSVSAVECTGLVERARQIHHTLPLATAALGRTLAAASMMGDGLKSDNGSVTVQIRGGGPLGAITAVADHKGNVRGYLQNPAVDLPLRADGKLDVGFGVGRQGLLTVIKDIGAREPFSGKVALRSGEIAEDIAGYYAESEQTPTVCALGVLVGRDQQVTAAGGYLVQLMPGAPDSLVDQLEKSFTSMPSVTSLLSQGKTMEQIMDQALEGLGFHVLEKHPVAYECHCSRQKVEQALISMGEKELRELRDSGEDAHITCQFCDAEYVFSTEDLTALLKQAKRP